MERNRNTATGRFEHQWGVVAHYRAPGEFRQFEHCEHCGKYSENGRIIPESRIPRTAVVADSDRPFFEVVGGVKGRDHD